jgi:hypothetical protein
MEKFFRRLHWTSIWVIGLQVLIWAGTGFAFTFFDFEDVRGNYEKSKVTEDLPMSFDVGKSRSALGARTVLEARCKLVAGRPVVEFRTSEGPVLVEGDRLLSPIAEDLAVQVAQRALTHAAAVRKVTRQESPEAEYDLEMPAWRVEFEDSKDTTIYVSPTSGEVLARRNKKWRLFDLLWSAHVLGYVSRSNPAHWPLRIVGGLALLVVLSGIGIGFTTLRRKHA